MANDNDSNVHPSVEERLRSLDPGPEFEPDLNAARARLRERRRGSTRSARGVSRLAVLAAVGVVMLGLPWTRTFAERLWDRLTVSRVEIVQISGRDVSPDVAAMFTFEDRDVDYPEAWLDYDAKGNPRLKSYYRRNGRPAIAYRVGPDRKSVV